jgi:hypothetical protein
MNDEHLNPLPDHRRLVQRLVAGNIPAGRELDECRRVLAAPCDETTAFQALFTLLRGALADPFFDIDDTQLVVPILKSMARGEVKAEDLL